MKRVSLFFLLAGFLQGALPEMQPFLDAHCMDCHDADVKKGGLDLSSLSMDGADAAAHKKWVRVFDRVASGEMPPEKRERPAAKEVKSFMAALGKDLTAKHETQKGTVLRRLNRNEYQNTLNDLLGVQVSVIDSLPEDGRTHGFDTVGEALSISGVQMQRYMEAAELALNAALHAEEKPATIKETHSFEHERNKNFIGKHWLKRPDGAIVVFNDGGYPGTQLWGMKAPAAGEYRLRIRGYGYQIEEPVVFALITGTFDFRTADFVTHSFHELPVGKPGEVEVVVPLKAGQGVKLSPQGLNGPSGRSSIKDGPANYPGEGFALLSVEVEGPLIKEWPPRGKTMLLGEAKVSEVMPKQPWKRKERGYKPVFTAECADPAGEARKLLPAFVSAAFRRQVTTEECAPYLQLFDAQMAQGEGFLASMRTAAVAVLCSPEFLFLKEAQGKLEDRQLATRLSYFLTRSAPDTELLTAKVGQPEVLKAQTERLLQGTALDKFVADFTDGWLNLREIEFTTPDKQLYPEYDELLLHSMLRETRSFITTLIRDNLDVGNLIHSDFAMLNSRLARHYGISGVEGLDVRKVSLPADSKRGGIMTHASVLKVSANGTNTSPVLRGVWVLDRMLGQEPPPPPPGTPGVEPDIRGATTLRELLDKHRSMDSCNGCHRAIDPPGFAMENYDVIGGWRERFRSIEKGDKVDLSINGRRVNYRLGPPVDASGELTGRGSFTDMQGFQRLLMQDKERVVRCVTEKLLTFACGREMGFSDRAEVERIVVSLRSSGHRMRDLIHAVIQSDIFRHR